MNHPFTDGNKRVGHAAVEAFLMLNGYEIIAAVAEQEEIILKVAAGDVGHSQFLDWLQNHTLPLT